MSGFEMLTISDLCAKYGRNPATIRKWVKRGYLPGPATVINRQHFWDAKAIAALKRDPREIVAPWRGEAAK